MADKRSTTSMSLRNLSELFIKCSKQQTRAFKTIQVIAQENPKILKKTAAQIYKLLTKSRISPKKLTIFHGLLNALGHAEDVLMDNIVSPKFIFENVVAPRRALIEWFLGGRTTSYYHELKRYLKGDSSFFGSKVSGKNTIKVTTSKILADRFGTVDITKSFGPYMYLVTPDGKGRYYIDFVAGFASMPFGWGSWHMENDLEYQKNLRLASSLKPSLSDFYHAIQAYTIEQLEKVVPEKYGHWFVIEGGAAANDMAIKAAVDWKLRIELKKRGVSTRIFKDFNKFVEQVKKHKLKNIGQKVIYFARAFHGRTAGPLAITDSYDLRKRFGFPTIGSFKAPSHIEVGVEKSLKAIRKELRAKNDQYCAIFVEPWQGEGGYLLMPSKILKELRKLANKYDLILVHDNIQDGMGRSGEFWPHQLPGYEKTSPDIMTSGKITQVSWLFALNKRFDLAPGNVFETPSRINSTFQANLPDLYRLARYIQLIIDGGYIERVKELGKIALNELEKIQREYPKILTNPRAKGTLIAFDVPSKHRETIINNLQKDGLLILACGEKSIRMPIPYNTPFQVLKDSMKILSRVIGTL